MRAPSTPGAAVVATFGARARNRTSAPPTTIQPVVRVFPIASAVPYGSRWVTCLRKWGSAKISQEIPAARTVPRRRLTAAKASRKPSATNSAPTSVTRC
jgi:hypothetical protein